MTRSVLAHVFDQTMRMLHPFMPFITEEIWQQLPHEGESITISDWPTVAPEYHDVAAAKRMKRLVSIIKSVRNIRAEVDTPMSKPITLLIHAETDAVVEELKANQHHLERFCNPEQLTIPQTLDIRSEE